MKTRSSEERENEKINQLRESMGKRKTGKHNKTTRDLCIVVRLSEEEKELVEHQASEECTNLAHFIRSVVLRYIKSQR